MSTIVFSSINENFPISGQDNDTQVFRDNFNAIKTALSVAKTEITALEGDGDITTGAARRTEDNDFNSNNITNAVFVNNKELILKSGTIPVTTATIDYENGNYQVFTIREANFIFDLLNLPEAGTAVGKIVLELYADDVLNTKNIQFQVTGTAVVKKSGFPAIVSPAPVGTVLQLNSITDPVIIEVWRHSTDQIFMKYVGEFA